MSDRLKNRLRLWRIEAGWTLEELSDLTGYSVSQLSRAERGERGLSPEAKVRISRRIGVPIRDLFDLDDDEDVQVSHGTPRTEAPENVEEVVAGAA